MESNGGAKEAVGVVVEAPVEAVFGGGEQKVGTGAEKKAERATEAGGVEKVDAVLPPQMAAAVAVPVAQDDSNAPAVARDAERMPKEYAKHLVDIMRKYKKDPEGLQRSVTGLKWDYMEKAFGRKMGDGLDGKGNS